MKYLWLILAVLVLTSMRVSAGEAGFHVVTESRVLHSLLSGLMGEVTSLQLLSDNLNERRAQLEKANLFFHLGQGFNEESPGSVGLGTGRQVISVLGNESLKVLPSRENENKPDPYLWMDSRNALILIDEMTNVLINSDPARAHVYRRNYNRLNQRASKLDRALEYGYRDLKGASAVLYHDVLQYFEQAYAFSTSSVLTSSGKQEVDVTALVRAREQLLNGQVRCLLVDINKPAPHESLLLQNTQARLGRLDVSGTSFPSGPDLYFELMEYNTRVIKECIGHQAEVVQGEELPLASYADIKIGRFMLTDHKGNLFTDRDMLGNYQLVNFGYTYCPDVCPTSLLTMSEVMGLLDSQAESLRYYFITVDPARDTAERMNQFVAHFSSRLIGLTGSEAMIARVAKLFGIKYEKVADPSGDPRRYAMDHSAGLFLMAPDGEFVTKFAYGLSAAQIAEKLKEFPM